ncbi:MAG TPA: outer membrane protein assembly factor BamD [Desulfuromonadales bacterium]|nr:outer membrane protein assembly factor BamD [Desulfuromonadales bacterium]
MRYFLFVALLLSLSACASSKLQHPTTAQYYLKQGEKYSKQGLYDKAIESWQKVRESFYSPELNALADMKIADAHYAAKQYIEAAAAYDDFLKQHPNNSRTPEILYKLGMSYDKQILSYDRDQTATHNALATFESLNKLYPEVAKKDGVPAIIKQCRELLAEQDFYIGHFYMKIHHPQAAIDRFKDLFSRFPDYEHLDKVYFYLGKAYLKKGDRKEAKSAFNTLLSKYPNSSYLKDVNELRKD